MTELTKVESGNLPTTNQEDFTPADMVRVALETGNTGQLSDIMDMYERWEKGLSEKAFNVAMGEAQAQMSPVAADLENPQTRSKYASYAALNKALRPIYTKHGFSLSFDTGDGAPDGHIRVLAYVAHNSGFTRTYRADMPADGKGAKGNDVMTKTHAAGAAMSYGMRYLLKMIFNVAVGEDDNDGNTLAFITAEQKEEIVNLMRETNTDTGQFLKYLKVPDLDHLPAIKFQGAITALNDKKARQ